MIILHKQPIDQYTTIPMLLDPLNPLKSWAYFKSRKTIQWYKKHLKDWYMQQFVTCQKCHKNMDSPIFKGLQIYGSVHELDQKSTVNFLDHKLSRPKKLMISRSETF